MATERRTIDATGYLNIRNKRVTITPSHVGQQVQLQVQGNGTFIPKGMVLPSGINQFDKTIYNLRASSALKLADATLKGVLLAAMKAEAAGDAPKADELFNQHLNGIQLSFSIIENGTGTRKFQSGDMVKGIVASATNKDGVSNLVINDVSFVAPTIVEAKKFDMDALLAELGTQDEDAIGAPKP
jgi:hypothetical protein